jgi:DNA-binding response OmpR family regulator
MQRSRKGHGFAPQEAAMSHRHVVLIVEDDPIVAETLRRWAMMLGCETEIASTVKEAEEKYAVADILTLDVSLPDGSGLDILRRLRDAGDYTPVIVVSGSDQPSNGEGYSVSRWLCKPPDMREFMQAVRAAMDSSTSIMNIQEASRRLDEWMARQETKLAKE